MTCRRRFARSCAFTTSAGTGRATRKGSVRRRSRSRRGSSPSRTPSRRCSRTVPTGLRVPRGTRCTRFCARRGRSSIQLAFRRSCASPDQRLRPASASRTSGAARWRPAQAATVATPPAGGTRARTATATVGGGSASSAPPPTRSTRLEPAVRAGRSRRAWRKCVHGGLSAEDRDHRCHRGIRRGLRSRLRRPLTALPRRSASPSNHVART